MNLQGLETCTKYRVRKPQLFFFETFPTQELVTVLCSGNLYRKIIYNNALVAIGIYLLLSTSEVVKLSIYTRFYYLGIVK